MNPSLDDIPSICDDDDLSGDDSTAGRFTIKQKLGRGSYGTVYEAVDKLSRQVCELSEWGEAFRFQTSM